MGYLENGIVNRLEVIKKVSDQHDEYTRKKLTEDDKMMREILKGINESIDRWITTYT